MAVEVETYEVEEQNETQAPEALEAEALQLIDDLGLQGQKSLVIKTPETGEAGERIPYNKMTEDEQRTYKALCPVSVKAADYSAGIIPVRVLQAIAHARKLFDEVQVWHPRVYNPDPVLVGKLGQDLFLLARWGATLLPFDKLRKAARESIAAQVKARATQQLAAAKEALSNPEEAIEYYFRYGYISI